MTIYLIFYSNNISSVFNAYVMDISISLTSGLSVTKSVIAWTARSTSELVICETIAPPSSIDSLSIKKINSPINATILYSVY